MPRDEYYNRAKQQGYRSRSAFKLRQLDDRHDLLDRGATVVDLGAAPGGWTQVAAERAPEGRVVAVDRQRIAPLDDEPGADGAAVETVRGDLTDDDTLDAVREALRRGTDRGDESTDDATADLVVSDAAPNVSGAYETDHARSVYLARIALGAARDLLRPGGDLAVKVFDGRDLDALRDDVADAFEYATAASPAASRDASSEVYLVGKGRVDAPVAPGDRLTVTIDDRGDEGDGIARVGGFTVFVPDAAPGDEVEIEVESVKPRFAFAECVGA
jgi:23S rRNA (uridine2552-2'-O)-methyltransferase